MARYIKDFRSIFLHNFIYVLFFLSFFVARTFFLHENKLDYHHGSHFKGSIHIVKSTKVSRVTTISDKPFAFSVVTGENSLLITGSTKTQTSEWVRAIQQVVDNADDDDDDDESYDGESDEEEETEVKPEKKNGFLNSIIGKKTDDSKESSTGAIAKIDGADDSITIPVVSVLGGADDSSNLVEKKPFQALESDVEVVQYGDDISLQYGNSFLAVDVCGRVVWVITEPGKKVPPMFERCLWKVVKKLLYTDQEAYAAVAKKNKTMSSDMKTMKMHAEYEVTRNVQEMESSGDPLLYGDWIQLQHSVTGKFLTAKNTAAKQNRDCLGLGNSLGSSSAAFEVAPRYKVRKEGGSVLYTDSIILGSPNSPGFYVHQSLPEEMGDVATSRESLSAPKRHSVTNITESGEVNTASACAEANLSRTFLECGLTINHYYRPDPELDVDYLHISQCIRLFDRENDGFLQADCTNKVGRVTTLKKLSHNDGKTRDDGYNHHSEFVSNAVWSVEAVETRHAGAIIEWNKPIYRIRHVPSNMFLTVDEKEIVSGAASHEHEKCVKVTLEVDAVDPVKVAKQTFYFKVSEERREYVPRVDTFVVISHNSTHGVPFNLHYSSRCNCFVMSNVLNPYDALLLVKVRAEVARTVRMISYTSHELQAYVLCFRRADTIPEHTRDLEDINRMIAEIITRSVVSTIVIGETETPSYAVLDKLNGVPVPLFQNCSREQLLLDVMVDVLVAPINYVLCLKMEFVKSKNKNDWADRRFKVISETHKLAWCALKMLVRKNSPSCFHVSKKTLMYKGIVTEVPKGLDSGHAKQSLWDDASALVSGDVYDEERAPDLRVADKKSIIEVIVQQLPYPVGAANFLNKLATDTKEIMGQIANEDTVVHFKNLLMQHGAQAEFVTFYKELCSCKGEAMEKNQNLLIQQIVIPRKVYKSVFIHTYTLPGNEPYKRSNPTPHDGGEYLGQDVITSEGGFPKVYVSWSWVTGEWTPNCGGLFHSPKKLEMEMVTIDGKEHVPVEELCKHIGKDTLCGRLAKYYAASIDVFAEMVFDRNYKAILVLEQLFPYVMLVGLVQNAVDVTVRTSFLRLLRRLWIERYPCEDNTGFADLPLSVWVYDSPEVLSPDVSSADCFPRFQRKQDELKKTFNTDPYYTINSTDKFLLVTEFIRAYLSDNSRCFLNQPAENTFMIEVVEMISKLLSFGFYSTIEKLARLMKNLKPLLDGRTDEESEELFLAKQEEIAKKKKTNDALGSRVFNQSANLLNQSANLLATLALNEEEVVSMDISDVARYKRTTNNVLVINVKTAILNVIALIMKYRQQYRLSRFIHHFRQIREKHGEKFMESVKKDLENEDNFARMMGALVPHDAQSDLKAASLKLDYMYHMDAVLADLMMYEDNILFDRALKVCNPLCVCAEILCEVQ